MELNYSVIGARLKQARIENPVLDNHMISGIVSSKVVFQVVQNSPQLVVKD